MGSDSTEGAAVLRSCSAAVKAKTPGVGSEFIIEFFAQPAPLPCRGPNQILFPLFNKDFAKVQAKIPWNGRTATWNLVLQCCSAAVMRCCSERQNMSEVRGERLEARGKRWYKTGIRY